MPLISKNSAIEALKPYLGRIYESIYGAWDDYKKYPDWAKLSHDTTTRANIINGHMIMRATKAFIEEPDVKIFNPSETKTRQALFVIGKQISLRMKKLGPDLMPRNISTQHVRSLNGQEEFEAIEAASHLVAGYTLNTDQTEIEKVYVVCPNNDKIYWEIELTGNLEIVSTVRDLLEDMTTEEYGSDFQRKDETTHIDIEQTQNGTQNKS